MRTDNLKDIFENFNPELTSDDNFMSHIKQSVDIATRIKAELESQKKINRRAILMSAIVGFLCGVVFTLFFPVVKEFVAEVLSNARISELNIAPYSDLLSLLAGCLTIGLLSFCTYELTFALRPAKQKRG